MTASQVASINLFAQGGVAAEDAKTNGLGNFAMDMLSRGTKTRSAQQIAEFFDAAGAQLDTACGNNSWSWKATCLKEDFAKVMEAYADVVNQPAFPEAEIGPMKERVLAAIEGQDADWYAQAMRFFKKTYFGPQNSPYQFTALGTQENVKAVDAKALQDWYENQILKGPRVLAIYGDVDASQAKQLAAKYFGSGAKRDAVKKAATQLAKDAAAATPSINVLKVDVQKTNNPQAGVVIGFKSNSVATMPDKAAIDVADGLCSGYGYPTGYIFEILRGRGLVYDANAFDFPGMSKERPGAFLAYAGCEPKNVNEVVNVILESVARLQGKDEDVQADWFTRVRQMMITGDAVNNETAAAQAAQAATDELFGLGYDYHDRFADRIGGTKLDDVRKVAAARLKECVVTISTPEPQLVKVNQGARNYPSFPKVDLTPRGVQHDTGGGTK
jgi:zinc protease